MNHNNSTGTVSNYTEGCTMGIVSKPTRTGLTCAYIMIFIAALVGNSVVIYVVKRKNKFNITFNYFILSMATADILQAFLAIPTSIAYLYVGTLWFSGPFALFLCKFVHYGTVVSIVASITTLSVTTIERFLAARLLLRKPVTMSTVRLLIAAVWIYSLLISLYEVIRFTVFDYGSFGFHCMPEVKGDWNTTMQIEMISKFIIVYALPLLIMGTLYTNIILLLWKHGSFTSLNTEHYRNIQRRKRNLIKRLVFITLIFAVCWLPVHVNHLIGAFNFETYKCIPEYWKLLFYWLGHANCAINPFLYLLLTRNARALFRSTVHVARHAGKDNGSKGNGNRKLWVFQKFPTDTRLLTACITTQSTDSQEEGKDNEMYELHKRSPFK